MNTLKIIFAIMIPAFANAQTTSPEVVAAAGDFFSNNTHSLSWTLGEIAIETYSGTTAVLTQGFQQPVTVSITGVNLDLLVFLEGPYKNNGMQTELNNAGVLPLSQPYNIAPWNYAGNESVVSIPNGNVVDWVLVELRDATSASTATASTIVGRQACFLTKDGTVTALDGSSKLYFNVTVNHNLYAVVWHRNHLGIMSANALPHSGNLFAYDFSTSLNKVYNGGAGYKEIVSGVFGMISGDANADKAINSSDKQLWTSKAGTKGYVPSDFNLDLQVDNKDKNDLLIHNENYSAQVPQ